MYLLRHRCFWCYQTAARLDLKEPASASNYVFLSAHLPWCMCLRLSLIQLWSRATGGYPSSSYLGLEKWVGVMTEGRVRLALVEAEAVPREGLIVHLLVT